MRISATIGKFKFDTGGFTKALKHRSKMLLLHGARDFIEVATARVPIYTGFARGGFLNLYALLRSRNINPLVQIPTAAQAKQKNGRLYRYKHYNKNNTFVRDYGKTPVNARELSTPRDKILKEGETSWRLTYEIRINYFTLNDEERGWYSFELGRDIMNTRIRLYKQLFPKVKSFVLRSSVTSGRSSPIHYESSSNSTETVK